MRRQIASITIALALIFPAAGIAIGAPCGGDALIAGDCCCDDGAFEAPAIPTVDGACCCELKRSPVRVASHETSVVESTRSFASALAVAPAWTHVALVRTGATPRPTVARGGPPQTLLALRAALRC